MKIKNNIVLSLAFTFFVVLIIPQTVVAHEPRPDAADGALSLTVGWRTEPAFAKQANAMDLFITDNVSGPVEDPSFIDIEIKILYLKEDAPDAKVIKSAVLKGDFRQDRSIPNRYNISVLLTKPGAYGFHIAGMINGIDVDETFICRGGSLNPDGRSFGCIEKLQKFPGGPSN